MPYNISILVLVSFHSSTCHNNKCQETLLQRQLKISRNKIFKKFHCLFLMSFYNSVRFIFRRNSLHIQHYLNCFHNSIYFILKIVRARKTKINCKKCLPSGSPQGSTSMLFIPASCNCLTPLATAVLTFSLPSSNSSNSLKSAFCLPSETTAIPPYSSC